MIFIFVDAYIWHTFTKDMKPEEFWTTFKGMKNKFYLKENPLFHELFFFFVLILIRNIKKYLLQGNFVSSCTKD